MLDAVQQRASSLLADAPNVWLVVAVRLVAPRQ